MPTRGERLQLLGWLLAAPVDESRELLQEVPVTHDWLASPLEELAGISLDEWQAEHTRLFVSGHPRTACPPFESAWVNGMMLGSSTTAVAELYRKIGLEEDSVLPDYLGTMLECAAYLEDQPDTHSQAMKLELWREHLERWLPRFAQTLAEESQLALYRELAGQLFLLCEECRD